MASILKVNTIQDATNSTTAMTIDSSGRVAQPQKPSITVEMTQNGYTNVDNNGVIPFNNVLFNSGGLGSSFDTSTYKLTVPIAGVYLMTFFALVETSENHIDVSFFQGNTRVGRIYQSTNRGISGSMTLVASVGDELYFKNSVGATRSFFGNNNTTDRYTNASFTLL